jgi:hypothetical protein
MPSPEGQFDLRRAIDRAEMLAALAEHRIALGHDALDFALSVLPEDWLIAWVMPHSPMFNIRIAENYRTGIPLATWAEIVSSIFDLRDAVGIGEQIRRLGLPSHEALDTSLAIRIAGRYARRSFTVHFEPNGDGCSDLLVENSLFRCYVEVKRENEGEHKRWLSIQATSNEILGRLEPLYHWLKGNELRVEIKLSRLLSPGEVAAVVAEVDGRVRQAETFRELPINTVMESRYIVSPRLQTSFYRKGIHTSHIIDTGTTVQLIPQNMPIQAVFDWKHNRAALKRRIRKASQQLRRDAGKDPGAQGFVVLEGSHGEAAQAIRDSFALLPANCIGVVLLSDQSCVIPRLGVSDELTQMMGFAGLP